MLRNHFWIENVAFLGMLEKVYSYSEYQNINSTGHQPKVYLYLWSLCLIKRKLACLLVIIVSLGYGIVNHLLGIVMLGLIGDSLVSLCSY